MKQQKKWFKKRNEKRRKKVKRNVREAGESALDVSQVYDGMTIHIYFRIYIFKYIYSFQTVTRFDCQGGTHPERSMVVTRSLQEKKNQEKENVKDVHDDDSMFGDVSSGVVYIFIERSPQAFCQLRENSSMSAYIFILISPAITPFFR